jgi:hypothetical protein
MRLVVVFLLQAPSLRVQLLPTALLLLLHSSTAQCCTHCGQYYSTVVNITALSYNQ